MFNNNHYIPAFWYSSNNFGDALTPYLIKKISGKIPLWVSQTEDCDKVLVTGSILNNEINNGIIWGCGIANTNDPIPQHKEIRAVRGKLTGESCRRQGIKFDEVYGDPALLLPRFYNPSISKKYKFGIIPHYVDAYSVYSKVDLDKFEELGIKVIDVMQEVEPFINDVLSCQKIISSTLHGIICAHAYGIPCDWVKFTDRIGGDDFKYKDYYSTTWRPEFNFIDLRNFTQEQLIDMADNYPIYNTETGLDLDLLMNNCPFKP